MRTTVLLIIALMAIPMVPVSGFHAGLDSGDAPNRSPFAAAGPDQRLGESDVILLDGSGSFDPDPDDDEELVYDWKIEEQPAQVVNAVGGPKSVPIPLQDAAECIVEDQMGIELEDWMRAYHAPYLPPGNPGKVDLVFNLTVYDREKSEVEAIHPLGLPYDANGDGINDYEHGWTGKVTSTGDAIWYTEEQNRTAWANYTNHVAWDEVTVTVDNTNHAPHGFGPLAPGADPDLCDEPHYLHFAVRHFETGLHDEFEAPPVAYDDNADVDIWEDRDDFLEFYVQGYDDRAIAVVEVYLYHQDLIDAYEKETKGTFACQIDDVDETYRFALGRHSTHDFRDQFHPGAAPDYTRQLYRGQTLGTYERLENWTGRMPVATPQLIEGEYRACARAFDNEGASVIADPDEVQITVSESLQKNQSPACLSILAPDVERAITPPVPETLPAPKPIKEFKCTYPEPNPGTCDVFPEQYIGLGGIVRLDIGIIPMGIPSEPGYEPETDVLIEKVLIQNELSTPTGSMMGPENVLEAPYVINLDTLARETSRINVRVFDRVGGVEEMCLRVTDDVRAPRVLDRVPERVYWGVNDTWRYYLQDKIPATSLQTILDFDRAGETKQKPSSSANHVTTTRSTGEGVVILPPLGAFPHYDISGDGFLDAIIDTRAVADPAILSTSGDWEYDAYFDYEKEELVRLAQARCNDGRSIDYYVESDEKRGCGEDETRILGDDTGQAKDGLMPSAEQADAEAPSDQELQLFLSTRPTRVLEHYVIPHGEQPLRAYSWHTIIQDDAQNRLFAKGTVELDRYYTDLEIVDLQLKDPGRGRLPGDAANLTGTVQQVDGIDDVEIGFSYTWDSDPWAAYSGLGMLEQQEAFEAMAQKAEVLLYQCLETPEGGTAEDAVLVACQLGVDGFANVTLDRTFGPGIHEVTLRVRAAPLINETQMENNTRTHRFEVYLGRTDVGEKSYYIRAGDRGMPRLTDGAIDLETNETYDLEVGEWTTKDDVDKGSPRTVYTFEVDGETYYWDPVERRQADDPETTCHRSGDVFVSDCRPITVYEKAHQASVDEDAPGAGLLLVAGLLLSAVAMVRRRR